MVKRKTKKRTRTMMTMTMGRMEEGGGRNSSQVGSTCRRQRGEATRGVIYRAIEGTSRSRRLRRQGK
jgi:hypothetical protein